MTAAFRNKEASSDREAREREGEREGESKGEKRTQNSELRIFFIVNHTVVFVQGGE